jgi:uncharacterized protein YkwD
MDLVLMRYAKHIRFAAFSFITGMLFAVGSYAAEAMTATQPLTIEGLTFSSPLLHPTTGKDQSKQVVSFGMLPPLQIKDNSEGTSITDILITPSPSPSASPYPTEAVTYAVANVEIAAEEVTDVLASAVSPSPTPASATPAESPVISQQLSTPGGLDAEKIFLLVNNHRIAKGLSPLQKDPRSCELASVRAPEIAAEIAEGRMHAGMYGRNLPYWNTENIIQMRTEEEAVQWWLNDYIHRVAIEGNYTYTCVACHGNNCAQEFTNFQPK